MSLVELEQQGPPSLTPGPQCGVGRIVDELPTEQRHALYRMLDDTARWPGTMLAEALSARLTPMLGRPVALQAQTVQRHRRRICRCDQSERDQHAAERDA